MVKQTCNECGKTIETGGFGGLPMKQHYKHKHPEKYYSEEEDKNAINHKITNYTGEKP